MAGSTPPRAGSGARPSRGTSRLVKREPVDDGAVPPSGAANASASAPPRMNWRIFERLFGRGRAQADEGQHAGNEDGGTHREQRRAAPDEDGPASREQRRGPADEDGAGSVMSDAQKRQQPWWRPEFEPPPKKMRHEAGRNFDPDTIAMADAFRDAKVIPDGVGPVEDPAGSGRLRVIDENRRAQSRAKVAEAQAELSRVTAEMRQQALSSQPRGTESAADQFHVSAYQKSVIEMHQANVESAIKVAADADQIWSARHSQLYLKGFYERKTQQKQADLVTLQVDGQKATINNIKTDTAMKAATASKTRSEAIRGWGYMVAFGVIGTTIYNNLPTGLLNRLISGQAAQQAGSAAPPTPAPEGVPQTRLEQTRTSSVQAFHGVVDDLMRGGQANNPAALAQLALAEVKRYRSTGAAMTDGKDLPTRLTEAIQQARETKNLQPAAAILKSTIGSNLPEAEITKMFSQVGAMVSYLNLQRGDTKQPTYADLGQTGTSVTVSGPSAVIAASFNGNGAGGVGTPAAPVGVAPTLATPPAAEPAPAGDPNARHKQAAAKPQATPTAA